MTRNSSLLVTAVMVVLTVLTPATRAAALPQTLGPAGLKPADLASEYDLGPLYARGYHGEGQTIALFEHCDFLDSDITTYERAFGLHVGPIQRIRVGKPVKLSRTHGQSECTLDIEMLHAIAPAATILVYEGSSRLAMWQAIVRDNQASVISVSWQSPELNTPATAWQPVHASLQRATGQKQAIFVSSGDNGAFATRSSTLSVSYSSSDPDVTAVGGTRLVGKQMIAWVNSTKRRGTGGGLSRIFARPWYQVGLGVQNQYSNGRRQVPDVAAIAAQVAQYVSLDGRNGTWRKLGGTSAAAPMWAAIYALIEQAVGRRLGPFNPLLYRIMAGGSATAGLVDVTVGNNLYYPATPHWDFATGWGTPDAGQLLASVKKMVRSSSPWSWHKKAP